MVSRPPGSALDRPLPGLTVLAMTWCALLSVSSASMGCGAGVADRRGWPMPNQPGVGLPNPQTYTVTVVMSEEVVQDEVTRFLWQRRLDPIRFTWANAMRYCEDLILGGWDDWRLPSRIEQVSLLNLGHTDPSIDAEAFPDTPGDWFWTASRTPDSPDRAWFVYFYFGYPDTDPVENQYPARCVRAPAAGQATQTAGSRYDVRTDVVADLFTRLSWQRAIPAGMFSFEAATAACADLELGGHDDWRLPSMQEFQTIVDDSRRLPAIDVAAFPDTPPAAFWSGTAWAGTPLLGWHVDFDTGSAAYDTRTTPYHVRCVRWDP